MTTGATIAYTLASITPVRLTVYDVAGRHVRRLVDETMAAGDHAVRWDRRNERGELVPPGVYSYALEAAGSKATGKVVVR
jgi:flagellar hook assembly protein FlgD